MLRRNYSSRSHVCGFYGNAILFGSYARKQAHSKLFNCFRRLPLPLTPLTYIHVGNAATGQKSPSAFQQMWPREVYISRSNFIPAYPSMVSHLNYLRLFIIVKTLWDMCAERMHKMQAHFICSAFPCYTPSLAFILPSIRFQSPYLCPLLVKFRRRGTRQRTP